MQVPGGGGGGDGGGGIVHHSHRPQFPLDDRDGFMEWLRSEFAAANAIIDGLCHHILAVNGGSGQYDAVMDAIYHRRRSWMPLIQRRKYLSVSEVTNALAQVAWRRRHQRSHHNRDQKHPLKGAESGFKQEQRVESVEELQNSHGVKKPEEGKSGSGDDVKTYIEDNGLKPTENGKGKDDGLKQDDKSSLKDNAEPEDSEVIKAETEADPAEESCGSTGPEENGEDARQDQNTNPNLPLLAKTFAATEMYDGMLVNVVQGLKLYEGLIDRKEVSKLVSLVSDLRAAGKAGKFIGHTYAVFKRPMRGRGREVIQLGLPIVDASIENNDADAASRFGARKVESIPAQLQDFIGRLVDRQVLSVKPDSCIIDLYNEGDHSQPHMFLPRFGRPVSIMFLSECDMTFGRGIVSDRSGNYKGSIKLSFAPGSLVVMEGQSANFSNHAINATRNQRILVTFTKSQPSKSMPPSSTPSYWSSHQIQPPNHIRNSVGPKNHRQMCPPSLLPTQLPTHHPHLLSASGHHPVFMHLPVSPALPYSAPGLVQQHGLLGWQEPQHPVPGTGVFIPSGHCGSESTQQTNFAIIAGGSCQANGNSSTKSHDDDSNLQNDEVDEKKQQQRYCNGSLDGSTGGDAGAAKGEGFSTQNPEK